MRSSSPRRPSSSTDFTCHGVVTSPLSPGRNEIACTRRQSADTATSRPDALSGMQDRACAKGTAPMRVAASLSSLQLFLHNKKSAGHICNHALLQQQVAKARSASLTADVPDCLLLTVRERPICISTASDARAGDVCICRILFFLPAKERLRPETHCVIASLRPCIPWSSTMEGPSDRRVFRASSRLMLPCSSSYSSACPRIRLGGS